ncbi:MAG: sterol desaturase/sphingolipid hydroxylase (fatty acid hydroxylase superfamily) [Bacteriovoracaceae bacterium]|jgi:sterol desaturase/sphingolipid hydroxylase (fatty acid hydroxylase superfamily)
MKKYDSIRIFKNPILEWCTHVHPIVPLLMWGPVVLILGYRGVTLYNYSFIEWIGVSVVGLLVWTFTEYALHRWVFHWDSDTKLGQRFVFLFHGLHHDDPDDPTRLVMPPVPAILIMALLYSCFSLVIPARHLEGFMAFFIIGYLCYDYIHYATHHFAMTSRLGRYLRKFHLQHHNSKEESKYGVSNPLWDYILGSVTGPKKEKR